jgi:hypothetical protein
VVKPEPQPVAVAPAPQPPPVQTERDVEKSFIEVVANGKSAYKAGSTDFQKGAARPARKSAICNLLSSRSVTGWRGKVVELSTNGSGKGVLKIEIAEGVYVETENNSFSDIGKHTLIEPGTPLFQSLFTLKPGDSISFSGTFIDSDSDCVYESSLTMEGSMTEPDFIFRFSEIGTR